ncbi:MAG: sensor histidine kinase [Geminicoccaceae bacterium]
MPSLEPGRLQIVFRDETEIATLEQKIVQQRNELSLAYDALNTAKERVEAALREKTTLLANVSHDLKTPLQVIMGNAEILRNDLPDEERKAFLRDIADNSTYLLTLITDLLDASAIDAAQMELSEETIDINEMLARILSMAKRLPGATSKRFEFVASDDQTMILADPMRLQRLLLNILSNAVKFTDDEGHVVVRVGRTGTGDLMLEVEDNGCGIEPIMKDRIFEPFTRSGRAEGTGLGLHIAKGLAELHDGDLSISSRIGVGTTAKLRLPKCRLIETTT